MAQLTKKTKTKKTKKNKKKKKLKWRQRARAKRSRRPHFRSRRSLESMYRLIFYETEQQTQNFTELTASGRFSGMNGGFQLYA